MSSCDSRIPCLYFPPMNQVFELDPAAVDQQFERRARRGIVDGFLGEVVEREMLARLEPVRLQPRCVLDADCALGQGLLALSQRFPDADLIGVDRSASALARAQHRLAPPPAHWLSRWFGRRDGARSRPLARLVQARADSLPVPDATVDLIWSRLALHWRQPVAPLLAQWYRVIRPGGLVAFSCLGVDTLSELRALGAPIMNFPDMHDLGDAMVAAGFAEPVLDTQRLTVTWRDPGTLLDELRGLGGNALRSRRTGLSTPAMRERWVQTIGQALARADGLIPISFELIYGHAWCPSTKRLPAGLSPVRIVGRGGEASPRK